MLNDAEVKGFDHVVSWQEGGRSFKVHDKDQFSKILLPRYFQGQTRYKSFQRQRKLTSEFWVPSYFFVGWLALGNGLANLSTCSKPATMLLLEKHRAHVSNHFFDLVVLLLWTA
jgi:hypothetical protein